MHPAPHVPNSTGQAAAAGVPAHLLIRQLLKLPGVHTLFAKHLGALPHKRLALHSQRAGQQSGCGGCLGGRRVMQSHSMHRASGDSMPMEEACHSPGLCPSAPRALAPPCRRRRSVAPPARSAATQGGPCASQKRRPAAAAAAAAALFTAVHSPPLAARGASPSWGQCSDSLPCRGEALGRLALRGRARAWCLERPLPSL